MVNRRKFAQCPNCGYTFEEVNNYCPSCGQENHNLNVPLKHLLVEFFEGTLHFDTKVWRTLKLLVLKPGLLTEKFNIGQRASYVPPFRLYVFVSLIFFFTLALTSKSSVQVTDTDDKASSTQTMLPGVAINPGSIKSVESETRVEHPKELKKLTLDTKQAEEIKTKLVEDGFKTSVAQKFAYFVSDSEQSKQKLFKNLSFMMFLLLPFFALVLHLYFRRQGRNYVEHLMFSIHLHTFYFIMLIVAMVIGQLLPTFDFNYIVIALMGAYLYFAMRQVYRQTHLRTLFSMFPISFTYLLTLFIFLVGTVAVSVMLS